MPILLSVGYAACHWCHVMAHDSFEDDEVAAVMNAHFVNIKVDREERPDIDAVYMDATTALTGQGGWPMTCLLTPDGAPFFAGTYFPRAQFVGCSTRSPRRGATERDEVLAAGQRVVDALAAGGVDALRRRHAADGAPNSTRPPRALVPQFDRTHGGFGRAPKFPPSMVLEFLLRHHERTGDRDLAGDGRADARGDGPRRHVRPARRRVRALLRRRRAGSCRTSRRCSTTTPCCCASTCTGGG